MSFELNASPDWSSVPGTRLEGGYELRALVSADGGSALFRTVLPGDPSPRGLARLFHLNAIAAARQRDLWQALSEVSQRNFLRIFSSGKKESGGEDLITYVVTEGAEESLATVLKERSLTPEETGGLVLSLVPALNQLHAAGFVHGRICPAEIFATADTIKISVECATRDGGKAIAYRGSPTYLAPEQQDENVTAEADVWCFGATLFEALTQTPFTTAQLEKVPKLPAPFCRIIADCVDAEPGARPRLAEILTLYEGKAATQAIADSPPPSVPPRNTLSSPVGLVRPVGAEQVRSRRRAPMIPVLVALFLVVVVCCFWWAKSKTGARGLVTSPDAKVLTRQTTPAPVPTTPAIPEPTAPTGSEPHPSSGVTPQPEHETKSSSIWRVVLWTYGKRSDAQSRVDALAASHPELHPEVFMPNTSGGLYLVVVGGEMTRQEAEDTRRRARQLGLPRDTYVQNFSR